MISKINVIPIIAGHLGTLRNAATEKRSLADIFIFYGIPVLVSVFFTFFYPHLLTVNSVTFLATVFSIFVGLLLNLLVLIVGALSSEEERVKEGKGSKDRFVILKEVLSSISYLILTSTLLLMLLMVSRIGVCCLLVASTFISYVIVLNFFLTLLMILKRIDLVLLTIYKPVGR